MRKLLFLFIILFFVQNPAQDKIDMAETANEKESKALMELAVEYFKKNDFKKSTQLLFQAKDLAEESNNHGLTAKIYGSLAHQYMQLNLDDNAKNYLDKAIQQINQMPEGDEKKLFKGLSYLDLGNITFDEKKFVDANLYYKKSLKEFQSAKSAKNIPVYHYRRSLYNIGNSFIYINKKDSAELFLDKALIIKDDENKELNFFINNSLSQIYSQRGQYQRAIDSLTNIINDEKLNNVRLESDIYYALSQNYKKIGDYDKSIFYNEKYVKLDNANKEKEFKAINSAMNEEQKDFKAEISDADSNTKWVAFTSFLFLVLLLWFIFYLLYKRKKERSAFESVINNLKRDQKVMKQEIPSEKLELKTDRFNVPELAEKELLIKLSKFEESGKFTNPKLNISNLAVSLKTNTSYLSDVINHHKGKNFNTYINELRIAYICEKIYTNKEYLNYKISYLAEESGFASHSAFATVFKNITGISPSAFLREASKNFSQKTSN